MGPTAEAMGSCQLGWTIEPRVAWRRRMPERCPSAHRRMFSKARAIRPVVARSRATSWRSEKKRGHVLPSLERSGSARRQRSQTFPGMLYSTQLSSRRVNAVLAPNLRAGRCPGPVRARPRPGARRSTARCSAAATRPLAVARRRRSLFASDTLHWLVRRPRGAALGCRAVPPRRAGFMISCNDAGAARASNRQGRASTPVKSDEPYPVRRPGDMLERETMWFAAQYASAPTVSVVLYDAFCG